MIRRSIVIFAVQMITLAGFAHADDAMSHNNPVREVQRESNAGIQASAKSDVPLYSVYCFGCHGEAKRGKKPALIRNAMDNNTGGMGFLKGLSPDQLEAISRGR